MSLGPAVAPALLSCENEGGARFALVICADLQGGALCALLWATPSFPSPSADPEMADPVAIQSDADVPALPCDADSSSPNPFVPDVRSALVAALLIASALPAWVRAMAALRASQSLPGPARGLFSDPSMVALDTLLWIECDLPALVMGRIPYVPEASPKVCPATILCIAPVALAEVN